MRLEADVDRSRVLDLARGVLLVTGPPGSGKTTLLRERFARLIEGGEDPERLLLLVLNRRAVRDGRDGLIHRLGRSLPDLPVMTAHGFAFRLLGRRFADLGYEEPPRVLSAPEQYAIVRDTLADEPVAEWPTFGPYLGVGGFVRHIGDFVLRAQERLLDPHALDALVERSGRTEYREVAGFYRRYLDGLAAAGLADFAGLLFQAVKILEREPDPWRHVLVDDYQDVIPATEGIVRALLPGAESVVLAADPAGHVFSYRGGSREPLLRIEDTLGSVERVDLHTSERLGADLPALAPLDDPAAPAVEAQGRIEARAFAHPAEEAEAVAHELLRRRVDEDVPWREMIVILRRYGTHLTTLRHALARHRIPFVVVAEEADVAVEPAVRPVIDLFRYVARPVRRDDLLEPLLTSPIVGLDPHALRRLRREARTRDVTLRELVEEGDGLPGGLAEPIGEFRALVGELPGVAAKEGPHGAFYWLWTRVARLRDPVEADEDNRDLDALSAFGAALARFAERRPGASIEDYLDSIEAAEFGPDPWIPPEERHPHAVRVISAHRAHGLECEIALVVGCVEGEFPSLSHAYPIVDLERLATPARPSERLRARLAEERALFRLAVTRARRATVLFAVESLGTRNPSTPTRFAKRLGLTWDRPGAHEGPATSVRMMETSLRRALSDAEAPAPVRLAALAALPALGARPERWWGHRDWTDPRLSLHGEDLRTSYSRLSVLQNCGLQYLYQVEMGLDPDASYQMWLGGIVHDIIDRSQQGEIAATEEALHAALDVVWDPRRFPSRAVEHRRHIDARAMLTRWLLGEQRDPVRSEVSFEFPVDGTTIRGRIDAIFRQGTGKLRIVDYKTSRYPMTKPAAKQDLQLAAYYLAVLRDPELSALGPVGYLQLAYLGKPDAESYFAERGVSPKTIDGYEKWAEETLRDLVGRVRDEDFAPSPEADCMWCSFKTICPVWPQGREAPT